MEQGQAKPFEPLKLNYEKWEEVNRYVKQELNAEDADRVEKLIQFLSGFTSELSLEILATVDFIVAQHPNFTIDEVMQSIAQWNMRKKELFKREYVQASYDYLKSHPFNF